ncbi:MAG: DsbA family protein [Anaerolineae bacterium]|nr:DsbA family protein [Anaerolineae bacterium]
MAEINSQDNQPTPPNNARPNVLLYGVGLLIGLAFLVACLITTPFGDFGTSSDDDSLSEDEVRQIVAEVVGTEIAAAPVGEDGLNSAQVQAMVDNAVATEVFKLIPTNTPIPPTPTIIPVGVAEEDDAFRGPDDAPVVITEFSDFQCGYCGRWYQTTLLQILEEYPDEVKFVYRDFPIFGEESYRASMATECAEEQGYFWEFHDRLFQRLTENEGTPLNDETFISYAAEFDMDTEAFTECMATERYADEVLADYQAAQNYGLRGTPGFVINGVVQAIGAQSFEVFQQLIEAELAKSGS